MYESAIALGTFDGIHIGHQAVLNSALNSKSYPIVITFDIPPRNHFGKSVGLLQLPEDKKRCLTALGFKKVIFLDFLKLKNLKPQEFLKCLKDDYNCESISCGFNYRFGKDGKGDVRLLKDFCNNNGIELRVLDPVTENGETVSSTYIRHLLSCGEIKQANELLYKPFGFTAKVVDGDKRGRTIGFPTINQRYPENLTKIKNGVYKSSVLIDGKIYNAITNIGVRPTFKTDYISAETNIQGFDGDIYGRDIELSLIEFIRDERTFSGVAELKEQIKRDIEYLYKNK